MRRGLLRIALHVLQHHGDTITRGWVPMLRLLEAVPQRNGQDAAEVGLGFQVGDRARGTGIPDSTPWCPSLGQAGTGARHATRVQRLPLLHMRVPCCAGWVLQPVYLPRAV